MNLSDSEWFVVAGVGRNPHLLPHPNHTCIYTTISLISPLLFHNLPFFLVRYNIIIEYDERRDKNTHVHFL